LDADRCHDSTDITVQDGLLKAGDAAEFTRSQHKRFLGWEGAVAANPTVFHSCRRHHGRMHFQLKRIKSSPDIANCLVCCEDLIACRKDTVTCRTYLIVRQQGEYLEEQLVRALKLVQGLAGKVNKPSNGLGLATKQLDIFPLLAAGGAAGDTAGQYSQASSNWSTRWRTWGRAAVETTKKASSAGVVSPPDPDPDGAMDSEPRVLKTH
jgi:hypothetical protein